MHSADLSARCNRATTGRSKLLDPASKCRGNPAGSGDGGDVCWSVYDGRFDLELDGTREIMEPLPTSVVGFPSGKLNDIDRHLQFQYFPYGQWPQLSTPLPASSQSEHAGRQRGTQGGVEMALEKTAKEKPLEHFTRMRHWQMFLKIHRGNFVLNFRYLQISSEIFRDLQRPSDVGPCRTVFVESGGGHGPHGHGAVRFAAGSGRRLLRRLWQKRLWGAAGRGGAGMVTRGDPWWLFLWDNEGTERDPYGPLKGGKMIAWNLLRKCHSWPFSIFQKHTSNGA